MNVLDFGLAKTPDLTGSPKSSPTLTFRADASWNDSWDRSLHWLPNKRVDCRPTREPIPAPSAACYMRCSIALGVWNTTTDVGIAAFKCLIIEREQSIPSEGMGCHPAPPPGNYGGRLESTDIHLRCPVTTLLDTTMYWPVIAICCNASVMWAMGAGRHVFGSASIGALRVGELEEPCRSPHRQTKAAVDRLLSYCANRPITIESTGGTECQRI